MGGKIWAEIQRGHGSQFILTLPLRVSKETPRQMERNALLRTKSAAHEVPKSSRPTRKILLAEDSPDNQQLILAFLKNEPYEVDVAENGKVALEKTMVGKYDLILMDMQMPEIDGYTATRLIRAQDQHLTIVALTANALKQDADKCLAAGCDLYLSKPIKKTVLLEVLQSIFSQQEALKVCLFENKVA